jgi:hypothetical protein
LINFLKGNNMALTKKQMQEMADVLIKAYKHEIIDEGDWWYGIDEHSFNIHSYNDDGWYNINVYDTNGVDNYDTWVDLEPVYLGFPK